MCTFGTKFPNIDNWNYISKFRIWYLEMDVHFQKSIFGILVPNGPYKKVLPRKLPENGQNSEFTHIFELVAK